MANKKIVVALGRNAFGETFPEQKENVSKAAKAIADLVEMKYDIVITHSNGPQVGMIQTAMTEFARLDHRYSPYVSVRCYEPGIYWLRFTKCHPYRAFKSWNL